MPRMMGSTTTRTWTWIRVGPLRSSQQRHRRREDKSRGISRSAWRAFRAFMGKNSIRGISCWAFLLCKGYQTRPRRYIKERIYNTAVVAQACVKVQHDQAGTRAGPVSSGYHLYADSYVRFCLSMDSLALCQEDGVTMGSSWPTGPTPYPDHAGDTSLAEAPGSHLYHGRSCPRSVSPAAPPPPLPPLHSHPHRRPSSCRRHRDRSAPRAAGPREKPPRRPGSSRRRPACPWTRRSSAALRSCPLRRGLYGRTARLRWLCLRAGAVVLRRVAVPRGPGSVSRQHVDLGHDMMA